MSEKIVQLNEEVIKGQLIKLDKSSRKQSNLPPAFSYDFSQLGWNVLQVQSNATKTYSPGGG